MFNRLIVVNSVWV